MMVQAETLSPAREIALSGAELEIAIVRRSDLAAVLGLKSAQMVDLHAREGRLVKADRKGWFKLRESITSIVEHQRAVAAMHTSRDGKHDVAAESAQLKAAQRRLTELKIRTIEGDLISATEALAVWGDFAKDVRAMILSVPRRVAGELPHLVASEIEILQQLAAEMLAELQQLGDEPPRLKAS